jgi:hypothetical protein
MTRRREPLANRWLWSGIVAGLLVSFLLLLAALCPPAAELVFGITILGALLTGTIGVATWRSLRRAGPLMVGMAIGFVAAFILVFVVFAQQIGDLQC